MSPAVDAYLATGRVVHRLAVNNGRELLGHILETDAGWHQAVNADGELIGSFRTRVEASRAITKATVNG